MDRNTLTGLVLIFIVIASSVFFLKPSQEEINRERLLQDSLALVRDGVSPVEQPQADAMTPTLPDSIALSGPFGGALAGKERLVTLENELIKVNINTKGGRVESVELKNET